MGISKDEMLEKSIIVAAHPDDEVLWFSSILEKVDEILLCYSDYKAEPEWGIGRRKSLSEYPMKNVSCLEMSESGTFDKADWNSLVVTEYGIEISKNRVSAKNYKKNYHLLKKHLRARLAVFRNVITHNPWGEYGHEEHIQIYRVIKELQEEMKFNLWFSNYCGSRSINLTLRYISGFDSEYITLKTDKKLGEKIKGLYKKNGCWTWFSGWEWFNEESFMKDKNPVKEIKKHGHFFPLNMIKFELSNEPDKKTEPGHKNYAKELIKKAFGKFGLKITKYTPGNNKNNKSNCISLRPESGNEGNVLLSYVIAPFLLKDGESISNTHTHHWESFRIAQTFIDMGYCVDAIHYENSTFIPGKQYSIFIGARTNFQRISKLLNDDCLKIVHLDTAHWLLNNTSSYRRCAALKKRKGITLKKSYRLVEPNWAIEFADCATILGNQFTIDSYGYARKPVYRIPISTPDIYAWKEDKDFEACKKNFLWFGSGGLVHKGLDLVLDVFAEMPDYHLTVCGPIQQEKDFVQAYYKELYQMPNIHTVGWVDVSSPEFIDITNNCIGLVYPSCSEGGGGSVINCMHAGLIPVVSYESSVDVDNEFGVILRDCSVNGIKDSIQMVSGLPAEELRLMSRKAWEFARANHTRERFAEEFKRIISDIIKDRIYERTT